MTVAGTQLSLSSKSDVGLARVDNTSDAEKPISTAAQSALDVLNSYGWPGGQSGEYVVFGGAPQAITSQVEARLICTPYWIPQDTEIAAIAIRVATLGGSGSVVRVGAYQDDDGIPGDLLFDAGTVDSTTTGIKEIATSQTLPAGRFWLAAVVQGGADPLAVLSGVTVNNAWNTNAILATTGGGMDSVYFSVYKGSVSGALPDPCFSSRTLSGGGANNVGYCFRIELA